MFQLPVLSEHTSPWLGRTISKPVGSLWASMSILGTGTPLYGRQSLPLREVAGPAKKQMPFLPLPFSSHSWPSGIADLPTRFNYRLREKVVFEFGSLRKKWLTSATGRCAFRRTEGLHGGEAQIISTLWEFPNSLQDELKARWEMTKKYSSPCQDLRQALQVIVMHIKVWDALLYYNLRRWIRKLKLLTNHHQSASASSAE